MISVIIISSSSIVIIIIIIIIIIVVIKFLPLLSFMFYLFSTKVNKSNVAEIQEQRNKIVLS